MSLSIRSRDRHGTKRGEISSGATQIALSLKNTGPREAEVIFPMSFNKVNAQNHLEEARGLYHQAKDEFERAKEKNDGTILRDACGKGWLATQEATHALLVKKGVKREELPRADRGRRFMVNKYAERELRFIYYSLRDNLHIEGYYDGSLNFDEVERQLDDLNLFIQKVEKLESD